MTSEIRTNSLKSRAGLSTVTFTDSGPMFSGITTFVDNSGFNIGTGSSIFSPATNTLTLGTNSNERLRITSGGQVNVAGNMQFTVANPEIELNNGGPRFRVPAANTLTIHNGGTLGSTNNEVLRITSAGELLQSSTGGNNKFTTKRTGAAGSNNDVFFELRSRNVADQEVGSFLFQRESAADDSYFVLKTRNTGGSNTERLRITSDGKVGISSATPTNNLTIHSNDNNQFAIKSGDSNADIVLADSGGSSRIRHSNTNFEIWTGGVAGSYYAQSSGRGMTINNVGNTTFHSTGHIVLPSGTTGQRVNTTGAIRYNNSLGNLEFYDGSNWRRVKLMEAAPTTGLLGYWPFSTASRSGSTYNDESGNGQHFTVNGTISDNTSESKFSGCIDFGTADGNHYLKSSSNSFTNIGTSSGFTGVSISVWVRTGNSTLNQWIVSEGTVNTRWAFFNESANAPKWRSTTGFDIIQSGSILDDVWHHLVVTYNHSTRLVQHYRDGSFTNQGTVGAQASFNGEYLLVGQHSSLTGNASSYRWRGKMAHMRIYNRVLTAAEVENLYNQW